MPNPTVRERTRVLETVTQGNHHIFAKDPSIPIFAQPISARTPTFECSNHSMSGVRVWIVNTSHDDVLLLWSFLPEVLSLRITYHRLC